LSRVGDAGGGPCEVRMRECIVTGTRGEGAWRCELQDVSSLGPFPAPSIPGIHKYAIYLQSPASWLFAGVSQILACLT